MERKVINSNQILNKEHNFAKVLNVNENAQIMTEQVVVETIQETESVCTSCIHFIELQGSFFCKLLGAFLSEKTLDIPCDFKEMID